MNNSILKFLISPLGHHELALDSSTTKQCQPSHYVQEGNLRGVGETEKFPIIEGIPLLQPIGQVADYEHNVLEILFGERTRQVLASISPKDPDRTEELKAFIKRDLGAIGVRERFERYAELSMRHRQEWLVNLIPAERSIKTPALSKEQIEGGREQVLSSVVEKRVKQWAAMESKWAVHLPDFAALITQDTPSMIVEMGTGAGLATNALLKAGLRYGQMLWMRGERTLDDQ
ncbi:MAG: hypothetical protein QGG48_11270, partial [Desulfatiglandales bacterium]|nr:hypothetical protein [Desulfatiglandales bacterium]